MVSVGGNLLAGRAGYWQLILQSLSAVGSLMLKSEVAPDGILNVLRTCRFRIYVTIYTLKMLLLVFCF
jgi:hypothetical protein